MRLWLKFARADELAYISHLDTHRAYYRLFRRAGLPLAYSQGFNPHPIISLASPMPLGYRSEADYVDLSLAHPMEHGELVERIRSTSGQEQLRFIAGKVIPASSKPLAAQVAWTEYEIFVPQTASLKESIELFELAETVLFMKSTKSSTKQVDAKPLVHTIEARDDSITAVLSIGEPVVFRPDEFLTVLSSLVGESWERGLVVRKELYLKGEELVRPLASSKEGGEIFG